MASLKNVHFFVDPHGALPFNDDDGNPVHVVKIMGRLMVSEELFLQLQARDATGLPTPLAIEEQTNQPRRDNDDDKARD